MTASIASRDEVLDRLAKVFRDEGYEAASLTRLAQASGLGKASLYYHFPNGKQEMALAVIDRANTLFTQQIVQPLQKEGDGKRRIVKFISNLDTYYRKGEESCLLGVLALGTVPKEFDRHIMGGLRCWIDVLAAALEQAGHSRPVARSRAEAAVCWVEGALVLSRGLESTAPFKRMLAQLKAFLLQDL
ncbi:TetR/AcrR family transcriptional regulator [Pollutimonas thiosulfatoxidans]|uniref:HTH tetR-type domain-containing protein n=1 Tax=Pollutimonas thiosulfatoxidans TaxID=2028345 RepID=A0A410GEA1_9BURK|nr:TetR/AcrR family transcriptional regulator [Pollutimonas thiosulfatoxidans]NYT44286.1 TetR/AcrR family transcriptional regulator [Alcaligenaceae bacterium]QAA94623.1 hypothetical protein CKA81_12850 [Pollutimonas thiosulfatoxidans]